MLRFYFYIALVFTFTLTSCGGETATNAGGDDTAQNHDGHDHAHGDHADHDHSADATPTPEADPLADFLKSFQSAVASNQPQEVTALAKFPMKGVPSQATFMDMYDMYFDAEAQNVVANATVETLEDLEIDGVTMKILTVMYEVEDGEGSSITYYFGKDGEEYKLMDIQAAG